MLREHGGEAYIASIDLEKAYDTVNRELLWKILAKYGVPEGLINVLKKLYAHSTIHLKIDGDKRWHFYTSGVKQGGPEASVLFSFFMDAVVRTLEREWIAEDIDIPHFRWHTDNHGNQLPKGQLIGTDALNKGKRDIDVWRSLYVDDMAVIFTNRQDVDKGMKLSVKHFRRFGLSIHTGTLDEEGNLVKKSKTEILYIPPKHQRKMDYSSFVEQTVDVMIDSGRFMSFCDKFKHLGNWITCNLSDDFDVDCRINAAMTQFYAWRQGMFQNRDMPLEIRVKVYTAVVVNTLLWDCETLVHDIDAPTETGELSSHLPSFHPSHLEDSEDSQLGDSGEGWHLDHEEHVRAQTGTISAQDCSNGCTLVRRSEIHQSLASGMETIVRGFQRPRRAFQSRERTDLPDASSRV